jgi:hypothetical protein
MSARAFTLAQFKSSDQMFTAARRVRALGFKDLDGHVPYPVDGLEDALGIPKSRVPLIVLVCGLSGATLGYLMQWWMNAVDWAINVGGRPPHSPPSFVPITFECGILLGSFAAFFGLWILSRLPRLHHPVFELHEFRSASIDRFWVSIGTRLDATEDRKKLETELRMLGAELISTVEGEP